MKEFKYAVVCIDDDPHILQMLGIQLQKHVDVKCTLVEFFTDPQKAIQDIDGLVKENIDVIFVVVDYHMPNMTGADFIRDLKQTHPDLKCIMLSGQANAIQVDDLVNDNLLDSFISKPWEEADLVKAIEPILSKRYLR
ncbi:MAG: response regulator [Bacteroidota bacterium]|jgi:CheY-like chemotaxis protein